MSQAGMVTKDINMTQGTITADAPQLDGTVTWNAAGVTFTAWKLVVTDTASAAASLLIDLQVGAGTSKFKVTKGGAATFAGGVTSDGHLLWTTDNTYDIGASGATRPRDIFLSRNAIVGSTIELGHASDTTLARVSAGVVSIEGTNIAKVSDNLSVFAATTSAQLAGVISDETGSGALVFGTSPTLGGTIAGSPSASGVWTFTGAAANIILSNADSQILIGGSTDPGWSVATVQYGARGSVFTSGTAIVSLGENVYYSDDFRYIASAAAAIVQLNDGSVAIQTGPSGTAGNAITFTTQVLINASGVQVGSPTGGAKGVGTANFAGDIYKNNSAYTNPHGGFEMAYTGKLDKYADRMAAMGLGDYCHWSIGDLEAYTRRHYHFPYFGDEENNGIFSGSERHLLMTELLAIYIFEQEKRLRTLEGRTNA